MTPSAPLVFAGAVLTGGASRRMGADKALLTPGGAGGVPLVRLAAVALDAAGARSVVAVGGDAVSLALEGLHVVEDSWPGAGPLGGIITAMASVDEAAVTHVVVLACDLVAPSAESVRRLVASAATVPETVAVPVVEREPQWLHACWPLSLKAHLEAAFREGVRAPRRLLPGMAVHPVPGLDPATLHDADSPGELPWADPIGT